MHALDTAQSLLEHLLTLSDAQQRPLLGNGLLQSAVSPLLDGFLELLQAWPAAELAVEAAGVLEHIAAAWPLGQAPR